MNTISTVANPERVRVRLGVLETAAFVKADAKAREKDAPDPRVSPLPYHGSFPCQQLKPGHVRYVTDDFCADYRRRCVCFDCPRGLRKMMDRAAS